MIKDNMPSFVQVAVSIDGQSWKKVETFVDINGPNDQIFIINHNTGTVFFGDMEPMGTNHLLCF